MQELTIVLKARSGNDKVTLQVESDGSIRLDDFSKFVADVHTFLKTFERSQTGNARAYKQWAVESMALRDIEIVTPTEGGAI